MRSAIGRFGITGPAQTLEMRKLSDGESESFACLALYAWGKKGVRRVRRAPCAGEACDENQAAAGAGCYALGGV